MDDRTRSRRRSPGSWLVQGVVVAGLAAIVMTVTVATSVWTLLVLAGV